MKTKSKRILTIAACAALSALLLLGLFAGCAGQHKMNLAAELQMMDYMETTMPAHYNEDRYDSYGNVALQNAIDYARKELSEAESVINTTSGGGAQADRFVIATADRSIQTKTYDAFISALKAELKGMSGYTNSFDEWNSDSDRRASIVARVPSEKLDAFLESLEKNGTVTRRNDNTYDVTDEMIDTGSRKEALKNEETALLAILEKAKNVEEIIIVQDRLSNVRAELQAYSQKLQGLQNRVNYSTVNIDVSEVSRITTPTQKFSALASTGFLASLRDIGNGLRNFALWFIGAIPYLVMLALPTALLVIIVRRVRKNKRAKKAARNA